MKNAELVKAFKMIAEGFNTLASAFDVEEVVAPTTVVEQPVKEVAKKITEKVQEEVKESEKVVEPTKEEVVDQPLTYTQEDLEGMNYNDLKALAKELGVKAIGTKKIIIDSILEHLGVIPTSEEPTATEEDVEEIETTDEVDIVEVDEDEDEEVEVEHTSLYDQVVEDLEGYTDEELADVLSDVGISPKGKRQALLAKIVQAIEEGVIEWEEDESEDAEVDIKEVEEDSEEHFYGTEARKLAFEKEIQEIRNDVEQGNISHKEILKYLKDFYNGKYTSSGVDGDVEEYITIQCDLIDDEGIKHDLADPYYVGDDVFCCGQHLKEVDNDLYCEVCGTTYEA